MTPWLKAIGYLGLILSVLPAVLVFRGDIGWNAYQALMITGMFLWFGTAVIWIKPHRDGD